ncbi:MAG: hypothetical protein ACP5D6_06505, partial [Kosmotogaceae bacterium]
RSKIMSKKFRTNNNFYAVSPEKGEPEVLTIFPAKGGPVDDTFMPQYEQRSVISAASNYLFYKELDEKLTSPELHIEKDRPFRKASVGAVSNKYEGDLFGDSYEDGIPEKYFVHGWAVVGVRNGNFYVRRPSKEGSILFSRYHDMLKSLIMGYGYKLNIKGLNEIKNEDTGLGWVDTILYQWGAGKPTPEVEGFREERYNHSGAKKKARKAVTEAYKANNNRIPTPEELLENDHSNGEILMEDLAGNKFNVAELGSGTTVKIYTPGSSKPFSMVWENNSRKRIMFNDLAGTPGYKAEVAVQETEAI